MGFVIFLLIVVGIIVIIVVVKKNKRKEAIEEFKNSKVYEVAVKIKEELEKKGYKFEGPKIIFGNYLYGEFTNNWSDGRFGGSPTLGVVCIIFSQYLNGLNSTRSSFLWCKRTGGGYRWYGIENANKTFLVYSREDANNVSQDIPESIKIASEVITNNGYGPCSEINE
jgi:hypothetical protein